MVTPGGELAFLSTILHDSLHLPPHTIKWYTAMVGKKSTLRALLAKLSDLPSVTDVL
jgi:23S rRNA A1618 N6-methylase RlmF